MADFDLKDFVRRVAPTVATALGGPLAGGVVSGLSQIFLGKADGSAAEIEQVAAAGNLTPDQITELKKLELTLKAEESERGFRYADLEFRQEQARLVDVQSAREREIAVKDNMPQIITAVAFGVYVLEFIFFASGNMPADEFTKALITRAFGTVDGILLTCVAYFVGSSRGSKNSGDALRRIAEAPVAAPVVMTAPVIVPSSEEVALPRPPN